MIGANMYNLMLELKKRGKSQRETAKALNVSKTTVNNYLNMPKEEARLKLLKQDRSSEFDIAFDFIKSKLEVFQDIRISKLYKEVKREYPTIQSKIRSFYNYIAKIKDSIGLTRIRNYMPIVDDEPGRQVQVDPGECTVYRNKDTKFKVYFVAFIFSNSRYPYVYFQSRPFNTDDFIKAHLSAFQYFGCIAKEYVYDQTKLVAIREKYREVDLNERFYQFSLKHSFEIRVCEGYDPQSKGKVERLVQEVKKDFLEGCYFKGLQDIKEKNLDWLSNKSNRQHTITTQKPKDLFQEELKSATKYYSKETNIRRVDKTGLISFKGNKYSVPYQYQRKSVLIRESNNILLVFDQSSVEKIAHHQIRDFKSKPIINNNHYRDYKKPLEQVLEEVYNVYSPYNNFKKLLNRIFENNKKIKRDQAQGLIKIYNKYSDLDWNEIIQLALEINKLTAWELEKFIERYKDKKKVEEITKSQSKPTAQRTSSLQRDTEYYAGVMSQ